jgi:hypothetical protein
LDYRAQKGGLLGPAASEGIAILFPDTSPRGAGIEGEEDDWDFGTGASFYLDATKTEYAKHYNMVSFITKELPQVIEAAGLPIVRGLAIQIVYLTEATTRTSPGKPFSGIVWVGMVPLPYTSHRKRNSIGRRRPLHLYQTLQNVLGEKRLSMGIFEAVFKRQARDMMPRTS